MDRIMISNLYECTFAILSRFDGLQDRLLGGIDITYVRYIYRMSLLLPAVLTAVQTEADRLCNTFPVAILYHGHLAMSASNTRLVRM